MLNARTLDWTPMDHSAKQPARAGDLVSAHAGGMPIYRVLAVEGGRAWVATGEDAPARAMLLEGFRWIARNL